MQHGGEVDDGQLRVAQQVDRHAAVQHDPFGLGDVELEGRKGHGARVGRTDICGKSRCQGEECQADGDEKSFHFRSPPFLVINPTMRFSRVKYARATRWMSAGVTAATLVRYSIM